MLNIQKFREIYEECLASGLTIREYCSNIGIHETTFYYWKKKLKNNYPANNGFIPLHVKHDTRDESFDYPILQEKTTIDERQQQTIPASLEITYPNGITVKLNGNHSIETLQGLILLNQIDHV